MLLYGTDRGDINILIFHTPMKGLFERPFKKTDTVWRIFFSVSYFVILYMHSFATFSVFLLLLCIRQERQYIH